MPFPSGKIMPHPYSLLYNNILLLIMASGFGVLDLGLGERLRVHLMSQHRAPKRLSPCLYGRFDSTNGEREREGEK